MIYKRIRSMPPEERDAILAEHLFGCVPRMVRARGSDETVRMFNPNPALEDGKFRATELRYWGAPPEYAQSPMLAFEVVEQLRRTGRLVTLRAQCDGYVVEVCRVGSVCPDEQVACDEPHEGIATAAIAVLISQGLAAAGDARAGERGAGAGPGEEVRR